MQESHDEAYGRNVDELLIPDGLDEEEKEFTGQTLSGTTVQRETLRCSKEGLEIPVLLGTIPVWLDGEVVYEYEQDDLLRVHLDLYIMSMSDSWQKQAIGRGRELVLKVEHVRLNVNQAVTAGLILNELFNLAEFSNHRYSADPYLSLDQEGEEVRIRFGIPGYPMVKFIDEDPEGFNARVLSVLLNQLNAHCHVSPDRSDEMCIRFFKADVKGSSSSFI
ncbi:MAG: hypothetical protein WEA36_00530 [Balneolaceae bacterium]